MRDIGMALIIGSVAWSVAVSVFVVMALSREASRRNGCGGCGCRRRSGPQGCNTTPRTAEPARGISPGWRE